RHRVNPTSGIFHPPREIGGRRPYHSYMPALEEKQPEVTDLQAPQTAAPAEVPPAPTAFKSEGELPAVQDAAVAAAPAAATASELAFEPKKGSSAAIDH